MGVAVLTTDESSRQRAQHDCLERHEPAATPGDTVMAQHMAPSPWRRVHRIDRAVMFVLGVLAAMLVMFGLSLRDSDDDPRPPATTTTTVTPTGMLV